MLLDSYAFKNFKITAECLFAFYLNEDNLSHGGRQAPRSALKWGGSAGRAPVPQSSPGHRGRRVQEQDGGGYSSVCFCFRLRVSFRLLLSH